MASALPVHSILADMPPEIVLLIMDQSDDYTALHSLVEMYTVAREHFLASYNDILTRCLESSKLPRQLQKIICTIISVNLRPKASIVDWVFVAEDTASRSASSIDFADDDWSNDATLDQEIPFCDHEKLQAYLVDHLQNDKTSLQIDDLDDPIASLKDIAAAFRETEAWEAKFIASKCRNPQTEKLNLTWLNDRTTPPKDEAPPSPAELCRIRRALWYFRLYFAIFYFNGRSVEDEYAATMFQSENFSYNLHMAFWNQLSPFETEEMGSACLFLYDQYHIQDPTPQGDAAEKVLSGPCWLRTTFGQEFKWCHIAGFLAQYYSYESNCRFITSKPMETKTAWSDSKAANRPNAGFELERLAPSAVFRVSRYPMSCLLEWGYCMWDEERIKRWRVEEMCEHKERYCVRCGRFFVCTLSCRSGKDCPHGFSSGEDGWR